MSLRCLSLVTIVVFITTEAASGVDVKKALGDQVSFRLDKPLPPPVTSIIWKHINSGGITVKAIEWDDEGFNIPNPRFRGITTLDEKTGQIIITNLDFSHTGVYTIDINYKEQEQRFTLTVMSLDVKKAVGGQVSFRLDKPLLPPVTSIIWKHRNSDGITVKAIEWDDEGFNIPNPRFRGITTLDVTTGQITLTKLNFSHSGVYTIDINYKEQEQRFTLTVKEPVPKPAIEPERSEGNPDVVYLRCEKSHKIIGNNSTREDMKCSVFHPKVESITVKNEGNPENFYTCKLDNSASKESSDPV